MHLGAAELVECDVLTGGDADDLGAGDEHVPDAAYHEDEVGDRRRIDGAAGGGPGDDRELGHHARGPDVAEEDVGIAGEGRDALLDAGAAGVVDADDRHPVAERKLLDLDDLGRGDLTERPAEHRRVIGVDGDRALLDGAEAGDQPVAGEALLLHPEANRTRLGVEVELDERPLVEEEVDAGPGGEPAFGLAAGVDGLVTALAELVDLLLGGGRPVQLGRLQVGDRPTVTLDSTQWCLGFALRHGHSLSGSG